jgi:hypothetical protein
MGGSRAVVRVLQILRSSETNAVIAYEAFGRLAMNDFEDKIGCAQRGLSLILVVVVRGSEEVK